MDEQTERRLQRIERDLERMGKGESASIVLLTAPLTSTSWDGDSFSTTAKTLLDLSAVFTVPDYAKAILVSCFVRDSGSATTANNTNLLLSPNNTAGQGVYFSCSGLANDAYGRGMAWVPCDANGDVYYQIIASGASTMDIYIQIWGYLL